MTPGGAIWRYAAGSFGTGLYSTVPSVLLLYFCTQTLHIPALVAGAIVLVPKAWTIVWDPWVGAWLDRTGRARESMIVGAIGTVLGFIALFAVPPLAWPIAAAMAGVAYFALTTTYSLFAVAYTALPARIAVDRALRAEMVERRMALVMVGVIAGAAAAPAIVAWAGGGHWGYAAMGLALAVPCAAAMALPIRLAKGGAPAAITAPLGARLAAALDNRPYRQLVLAFLAQSAAVGGITAAAPYIAASAYGRPQGDVGIALGLMLITALLTIPLWARIGARFGEARALGGAAALYALGAGLSGALALSHAPIAAALAALVLVGIAFAGLQVLAYTRAAHVVHRTAPACRTLLTGLWTACEKLGLALGSASVAAGLELLDGPARLPLFLLIVSPLLALGSTALLRTDASEAARTRAEQFRAAD